MEQSICRSCSNLVVFKFKQEKSYHYYCPKTTLTSPDILGLMEVCSCYSPITHEERLQQEEVNSQEY